ncbi:uncharacterized protein LOC116165081 [Photinus pyralis]|uniref:uncharacterized protein LOC116165081 n=1 Tax=Photinus pyralis TaxID=7054 RepID=UPI00126707E8|nr:uncharacterized protein LOC116165081 [Photinus pyralis]
MQNVHKTEGIKSRRICSVPKCSTYRTSDVSLHRFPNNWKDCQRWKIILRIGKPITKEMFVCSKHFKLEDFMPVTSISVRKRLKKGVVPQNIPIRPHDRVKKLVHRSNRTMLSQLEAPEHGENVSSPDVSTRDFGASSHANLTLESDMEREVPQSSTQIYETQDVTPVTQESLFSLSKGIQVDPPPFKLSQLLNNDEQLLHFTGINSMDLNAYVKCLQNCCQENSEYLRNNVVLVMCKLKTNLSFVCLAVLFGMNISSCKRAFYKYLSFLAASIKPAIYWPTKDEIRKNLPLCFKDFKATRLVLDATEIKIQKLNCLKCRVLSYSHYKGCHTMKFLIGITPSGLISYVSKAYGGRSSDRAIFCNENVVNKLDPYDAVMVDKGILIEKDCEENLITLIRPPFLRKNTQLSKVEALTTANIARARVHVERAIQRLKLFSVLNNQIDWYLIPYMDDIMTVIAATVNMSSPILAEDKF